MKKLQITEIVFLSLATLAEAACVFLFVSTLVGISGEDAGAAIASGFVLLPILIMAMAAAAAFCFANIICAACSIKQQKREQTKLHVLNILAIVVPIVYIVINSCFLLVLFLR